MKEKIKIAYLGLGRRGAHMLEYCMSEMKDAEITVLCDIYEPALQSAAKMLEEKGYPMPILTTDYRAAIENPDVDAVMIMTGWREHAMLAEMAMLAGKYTAIEVGCAFDLQECHRLIEAHEKTGAHLMMLENSCYDRREMMATRMAREGLFGRIMHCSGGYMHNLPEVELFKDLGSENPHYRLSSYIYRNCEQYPTHDLGPIAKLLNLNYGNRMVTLSSFASGSAGLKESAKQLLGEESPYAQMEYKQGDIITTVITCAGGETIQLTLDTTLPRPYYSRGFTVRGTKGMCAEERRVFFLEGMEEPVENNEEEMFEKYDHPLHREYQQLGTRGGHGGVDWLICRAFIESVKRGIEPPIDTYDSVSWMAIASLSEMSIAQGGMPVAIPDFTKGRWMDRRPKDVGKYSLNVIVDDPDTPIYPEY